MSNNDSLVKVHRYFGKALLNTLLPATIMIGLAVLLTAMQVAFAAPSPP